MSPIPLKALSGLFGGAVVAQEIGVAYVSLLPSGAGFSKAVDREASQAFAGAEKRSRGFFSSLAGGVGRIVGGVGLLAGSVGALAVGGGISRALNIEDATAKLKGLGHDTRAVEAIMKDALASVKGTAFGLDAAATTAASAVAAGIRPGQELERYLRLTADAATIAGTSMEEMGSIINQVTSKGYAGMENLNRLTERGIPILQWLAAEYGVTADELQKMVSRGEVDAATFRKVIEDNIGGAALASGETTRGSLANLGAAISRLGAAFAGPVLGLARDFFNELIKISDGITTRVQPVVAALQSTIDGIDFEFSDNVLNGLDRIVSGFSNLKGVFGGMEGLTPVFTAMAGAMAPLLAALPIIGRFLPVISGPMGALIGLLAGMFIESEELRASVAGLGEAFRPLGAVLKDLAAKVGPVLSTVLEELGSQLAEVLPLLAESLIDALVQLAPPLTELLVALLPLIPPLIELAVDVLPVLTDALALILPVLVPIVQGITAFYGIVSDLFGLLSGDKSVEQFGEYLATAQGPIYDVTRAIASFIMPALNGLIQTVQRVVAYWQVGWTNVSTFFNSVRATVTGIASNLWGTLTSLFTSGVSRVGAVFRVLPTIIRTAFAGVGSWLVGSGRALMQGFIDGITSMIGAVGSAVGGVLDWASGFFPHSPAERGPFSGTGWTDVFGGGEALMEQFAKGAESHKPTLTFSNVASVLQDVRPGGDTYVQNPFTGEYLLAKVGQVADARVDAYDAGATAWSRGGVRP